MIIFDLQCDAPHRFEAWFASSQDYDSQRARGLIACPQCHSSQIDKAPMAPAVVAKGNRRPAPLSAAAANPEAARVAAMLAALRAHVEAECDYVGDRFAEEARAIHYGEREADRGIYGETSGDEAAALAEEGIAVAPLPFRPRARLNG